MSRFVDSPGDCMVLEHLHKAKIMSMGLKKGIDIVAATSSIMVLTM